MRRRDDAGCWNTIRFAVALTGATMKPLILTPIVALVLLCGCRHADLSLEPQEMVPVSGPDTVVTPTMYPDLYAGRCNEGRKRMLARFGGSNATEDAVLKALRWLKAQQNLDGSWSQSQPQAMCGLALLAYLAHGETSESPEFGATVQKASQYLADAMMACPDPRGLGGGGYVNGICTCALCEAYGMTRSRFLKPAAEKGLTAVLTGQQPCGGFDYCYVKGRRWDVSVTGWQVQAMKAGYVAGCETPGIATGMENASNFLRQLAYANGRFGYAVPGSGSWGVHSAGTWCLQITGHAGCPEVRAALKTFDEGYNGPAWDNDAELLAGADMQVYCWYYATQAMFHAGPTMWKKWNSGFPTMIIGNQQTDGHWDSPGKCPDGTPKREYDPYYATCLCCLSLEVYYRYLPTYKMPHPRTAPAATGDE